MTYGSFSSKNHQAFHAIATRFWSPGALEGSGRLFPEAAAMGFELRARLTDLKRAFRRLLARLPDEMEAGCDFILFKAGGSSLEIVSGGTSEVLKALILHQGKASVPEPVFRGSEGLTILSQKDRYGCCFAGLAQNRTH